MSLMDILAPYATRPTDTHTDFDEVSRQVPPDVLGDGLTQAFRADQTPPFGAMAASLFGGSNPQQRAGLLGQLLQAAGPAILSSLAGGRLGDLLKGALGGGPLPTIAPDDADRVTPDEVREIATEAERKDPGVLDRVGAYYAQHPEVVKVLGGAALAIALGRMAGRMQQR